MSGGRFCLYYLARSISNRKGVKLFFIITMFIEIHILYANSVNPDQTPHSAASDLGLHCVPVFLLWDARH